MTKYTGINKFLNYFPHMQIKCKHCSRKFAMRLGMIRYSKAKYGGPYCPKCGNPALKKSKGGESK